MMFSAETNTLGVSPFTGVIDKADLLKLQSTLPISTTITLNGYAMANIPTASHDNVKFVCVNVVKGVGSTYTDTNLNNNYKCIDISGSLAKKTGLYIPRTLI